MSIDRVPWTAFSVPRSAHSFRELATSLITSGPRDELRERSWPLAALLLLHALGPKRKSALVDLLRSRDLLRNASSSPCRPASYSCCFARWSRTQQPLARRATDLSVLSLRCVISKAGYRCTSANEQSGVSAAARRTNT